MDAQTSATSDVMLPSYAREVLEGLNARRRRLPAHLLYDARGSALFELITCVPEYYLTRTELQILEANAADIAARTGPPATIVELGAGTATKTRVVLDAVRGRRGSVTFCPVDVSAEALAVATRQLTGPGIDVRPLRGRYEGAVPMLRTLASPRLVLFIGSSIGNLEPEEAVELLSRVREALSPGDTLLLGADLHKSASLLLPAYDDAAGVTAAFEKNVLVRLNRELGADFQVDAFDYRVAWNARESRVEMWLESACRQRVRIPSVGVDVVFAERERIDTERSYKWTAETQLRLLRRAGFRPECMYTDPNRWFAVHVARAD